MKIPLTTKLYLAHPLKMETEIRKLELATEEKTGIQLENPFWDQGPDNPEYEDLLKIKAGEMEPNSVYDKSYGKMIVEKDMDLIKTCNGIVAVFEKQKDSIGTHMELFFASRILGIPSYIITSSYQKHPWVIGLADKVFNTWQEFEDFIEEQKTWK